MEQLVMDLDALEAEERHKMKVATDIHEHAELYKAITAEVEAWPYSTKTPTIDKWVWDNTIYPLEELQLEDDDVMAGVVRFKAIQGKVADDFTKVIDAMTAGAIQPHGGGMFPTDAMGFADIGPYALGCSARATIEADWYDPERIVPDVEPWHTWSAVNPTNEYFDRTIEVEGKQFGVKYWGRMYWHDMYVVLRNLCAAGYENAIRHCLHGKPETVTLAQYAKAEVFQNHDFSLKVLNDGLFAIAMGQPYYELTPKGGRSREVFRLTASEGACTEFLQKGGNGEIVKAILGTVHALKEDPRAAEFVENGFVWFSVNKIAEEALRTSGGTIKAKDYPNATELVDAALVMAAGAQIVGKNAKGEPTDVMNLVYATRRDEATYGGNVYRNVWGFAVNAKTISEYAIAEGNAYHYPLLDRKKPFTIDTLAINEYLSDALSEARGKVYTSTKTGQPRKNPRCRKFTIKRSWSEIFGRFSPVQPPNSRQKYAMVRNFEGILTDLIRQESHGERREGRPLYVYAWSERDKRRGRGKGMYLNLYIEVSSEFHTVRDGSKEHGAVNLHDGEEGKMPDDAGKV